MKTNKTAVEWLLDEYFGGSENCTPDFKHYIEIALEMENRQSKNYAEFAIHCDREGMKILNFNDYIKL